MAARPETTHTSLAVRCPSQRAEPAPMERRDVDLSTLPLEGLESLRRDTEAVRCCGVPPRPAATSSRTLTSACCAVPLDVQPRDAVVLLR
ncbi:MAG: hypothetical protein EOO65_05525, partial [Methanosarcinales archaeon]